MSLVLLVAPPLNLKLRAVRLADLQPAHANVSKYFVKWHALSLLFSYRMYDILFIGVNFIRRGPHTVRYPFIIALLLQKMTFATKLSITVTALGKMSGEKRMSQDIFDILLHCILPIICMCYNSMTSPLRVAVSPWSLEDYLQFLNVCAFGYTAFAVSGKV